MHCFVALEHENPWLRDLDIDKVNAGLAERRQRFAAVAADADRQPLAAFWALPRSEREAVTPEVREVRWMPLRDAVKNCLSSMSRGVFVNDFQRETFEKYGRTRRDPMFITAAILVSVNVWVCGFGTGVSVSAGVGVSVGVGWWVGGWVYVGGWVGGCDFECALLCLWWFSGVRCRCSIYGVRMCCIGPLAGAACCVLRDSA
jgi:hypothetical protein